MKKHLLVLPGFFLGFSNALASELALVEDGKPGPEAIFFGTAADYEWQNENGALKNSGMYKFLAARHRFMPE